MLHVNEKYFTHIFNSEKTIFDNKKNEKYDMTSFNLEQQKQAPEVFYKKRCSYKFHRKEPVSEPLFSEVRDLGLQLY